MWVSASSVIAHTRWLICVCVLGGFCPCVCLSPVSACVRTHLSVCGGGGIMCAREGAGMRLYLSLLSLSLSLSLPLCRSLCVWVRACACMFRPVWVCDACYFPVTQPHVSHAGHLPFEGRDKITIKERIKSGQMKPLPERLSTDCANFLLSMLTPEAALRPSAESLLSHPFIMRYQLEGAVEERAHSREPVAIVGFPPIAPRAGSRMPNGVLESPLEPSTPPAVERRGVTEDSPRNTVFEAVVDKVMPLSLPLPLSLSCTCLSLALSVFLSM
jgi:hypothetical protein